MKAHCSICVNADIHIVGKPDEEDDGGKCIVAENGVL